MDQNVLNYIFIGLSFALYIGIAIKSRAGSTKEFYTAGGGVSPFANGMATAADWMSAAILMVPYLRKFGKATVPDFIGDRYYSKTARLVAVLCALFICMTYIMGQMRGVGIVFSNLFEIEIWQGVLIGSGIVFFYAGLGGMKGITYTQVAQYCVMVFAYTIPAILISMALTGNIFPQLGFIGEMKEQGALIEKVNAINTDLGFSKFTDGSMSTLNMFCITAVLMCGTAGLPHVIVRFFTVKNVKSVRKSACWTLFFIAIIYLTAPTIGVFSRVNLVDQIDGKRVEKGVHTKDTVPDWYYRFEKTDG